MPVFNGESSMRAAIDSVLAQTYPHFELVVVDDGSTDATAELLCLVRDERLRVIRHTSNEGLVASLNDGLAACRGELVARLDADDVCRPERIARQVALFAEQPRLALAATGYQRVAPGGVSLRVATAPRSSAQLAGLQLSGNRLCHSTVMFRKSEVEAVGGYRQEWFPVEDFDLWLRLCPLNPYASVETVEVLYLENPEGISAARAAVQSALHRRRCGEAIAALAAASAPPRVEPDSRRPRMSDVVLVRQVRSAGKELRRQLDDAGEAADELPAALRSSLMILLAGRPRWWRQAVVLLGAPGVQFASRSRTRPRSRPR